MSAKIGTDVAQALRLLSRAEPTWTGPKLAAELGVHPRTVARWAADQHQPSPRNRAALAGLIRRLRQDLVTAPYLARVADDRLHRALVALRTGAERAEAARAGAEVAAAQEALAARQAGERAARLAARRAAMAPAPSLDGGLRLARPGMGALVGVPGQRRPSVIAACDPWDVVATGQPELAGVAW